MRAFPARLLAVLSLLNIVCALAPCAYAAPLAQLRGIVHDPQHRPLPAAHITLKAANSAFSVSADSNSEGAFTLPSVTSGDYVVTVSHDGFATLEQPLTVAANTSPMLHFELQVGAVAQSVTVTTDADLANVNTVTPTTLLSRLDIAETPGADRTNSMAMITDYVPGAYMTHDMLHMRGGHQVSWLIDGVQIPNTNIASNLAAQIDPKDIDYLEVQRGSYSADNGDRTYGVFNVVPRSGFERDRQAELVLSAGNFYQTDDQFNLGDHTGKLAYYGSLNANRSNYGLAPPIAQTLHDASNGIGAFISVIDNHTAKDQFRIVGQSRHDFFQIPYDPNPNDFENQQYDSSGLRDTQSEFSALAAFTWAHSFSPTSMLQVSPFFNRNTANYNPNTYDQPVATTSDRASTYSGLQATIGTQFARNTLQGGFYSFGQHDYDVFGALFNDGSSTSFNTQAGVNGGLIEEFVSDTFKPIPQITVIGGLRESYFTGPITETHLSPRIGLALQVPRLNWVFRAFYGRFYQPPPLLTAACSTATLAAGTCPTLDLANSQNTSFKPLPGERDEEHQFGVQIPFHGWLLDADTFKTRADNFLDHSNLGESSIYFPITTQGALIRAWELTLRSPRLWHFGQAHLAYSNQIGEQIGGITGGLVCFGAAQHPSDPCYVAPGYTPLDHDQRDTLNAGFNASLPWKISASTNYYFGSGFHNGDPDPTTPYPNQYLPYNTTFDLSAGKSFGENIRISVTATNVADRRTLLDNSLTFGGFHYNDPRQIYGQLRYRFKF
jgi:TonB dependent receptor/Carboxypeptidase regulatory-like domain/TonB-dependent Receptor Plug Domain